MSKQARAVVRTQVVQAAQDGVLSEMLAREGQTVKKGDLLALLDSTRARAAYEDSVNTVAAPNAALVRLRAEVSSTHLSFGPELQGFSSFRANQERLFRARRQSLEQATQALQKSRHLVLDELRIMEPLLVSGDIGQAELIRLRRQEAELNGQIVNLRNKFFQDAQVEMTKAEEDLATQAQLLEERSVALRQTELRAPTDGTVREIVFTTIGAAVRNGDVVLEMSPIGSELMVEAKYAPSDVAALSPGMPARVKLDAFDDSICGAVDATISDISPDALNEPDGRRREQAVARVRLQLGELPAAS